MGKHYLIDHQYLVDNATLHATMGHLLIFDPSGQEAQVTLTFYFEDHEPESIQTKVSARTSRESNYSTWPVRPGMRFALEVDSSLPVACQSTIGWNNSGNDYAPKARTHSPFGVRETAKSYMAITRLSKDWYLPDGIVIDCGDRCFVRESEWAAILNPGPRPVPVELDIVMAGARQHIVEVPARRLRVAYMDDLVQRNKHYGVHFRSDAPVAASAAGS